jgi:hypothetical protein
MAFPYRHKNGLICCSNVEHCCDSCKATLAAEVRGASDAGDCTPPDAYAKGIAAMRAASSTPEVRFEEKYKADRLRALELEPRTERRPLRRSTAAEMARYDPPNGYQLALDALKENRR